MKLIFAIGILFLALTFVAVILVIVYYGTRDLGGRDSDF